MRTDLNDYLGVGLGCWGLWVLGPISLINGAKGLALQQVQRLENASLAMLTRTVPQHHDNHDETTVSFLRTEACI